MIDAKLLPTSVQDPATGEVDWRTWSSCQWLDVRGGPNVTAAFLTQLASALATPQGREEWGGPGVNEEEQQVL